MRRLVQRKSSRRLRAGDVARLTEWLGARGIRYCRTNVGGVAWRDNVNRGAPPLLIFERPPSTPEAIGVAMFLRPSGVRQITSSQGGWAKALSSVGWVITVAFSTDEAIKDLESLGYGCQ